MDKKWSKAELTFWQSLLDAGLIKVVPQLPVDPDVIGPIPVKGRPVSEEIIADRR